MCKSLHILDMQAPSFSSHEACTPSVGHKLVTRGKAESEGVHLSSVNCARHRNDLGSFVECFLGIRDDHLPWWRDAHALPGSHENRKPQDIFEIFDLFAEGRLCKKEFRSSACNGGRFRHCGDVLQMPELHEI